MINVLITGVSSGIGEAIVTSCLQRSFRVFGTVRTKEDASRTTEQWKENFTPVFLDVTQGESIQSAVDQVKSALRGEPLHVLVNNSGIAIPAPFEIQPIEEIRKIYEVNVFGLMNVIKAFLPLMKPAAGGTPPPKIINISSGAGKFALPFLTTYSSSKHALEGFSNGLRIELRLLGIQVVVIGPGSVQSAIWEKAAEIFFPGTIYEDAFLNFRKYAEQSGKMGLEASALGKAVARIILKSKPRTRYSLSRNPWLQWYLPLILTQKMFDYIVSRALKIKPLYSQTNK